MDIKEYKHEHYIKNKEKYNKKSQEFRDNNKDYLKEYFRKYREENKQIIKERRKKHYQENKQKINQKNIERKNKNPNIKIAHSLRNRIIKVLNGTSKSKSTVELLGCSIDEFRIFLENKFYNNMSWENYGSVWHIDHIKPCASFDLILQDEQEKCFHYSNMQPLLAEENLSKGKKIL